MPTSEVQALLDIPNTLSVACHAPGDQLLPLGRTHSQPTGESIQGPPYSRRARSESSLDSPVPMPVLQPPPAADDAAPEQPGVTDAVPSALQAPEQPASAPSPVPTEIIPPDLTQEEIVFDIQQSGIKVRDFAYEPFPPELRAPELFDPILGWHVYEAVLDDPNPRRSSLNGKHLRRLLDLGWLSEEADVRRWQDKDREALETFDSRPHYPWKAFNLAKPKKRDLKGVATARFQWVNAEQLVPQFVNRGISRFAAVLRGSRYAAARYQKRLANDATETKEDPEVSPQLKKRRLSTSGESTLSGSQSSPSSSAQLPLALVNGKPPQQFPAGHPSDSPSQPAPFPTQGALSRSLQRQLSMTSVATPDPRAMLTPVTNHE